MDQREFIETQKAIDDDAVAIIHNQKVLARIKGEIIRNIRFPFEQDYIYEDHDGLKPSEPSTLEFDGVRITRRVLHQTGIRLSDISGADLLYEIENEKFALIQYKKASESGFVRSDIPQLNTMLNNCPEVCRYRRQRPIPLAYLPIKTNVFCGCWYCIIIGAERYYVHACETETVFLADNSQAQSYFSDGISRNSFLELFGSCRIGALLKSKTDASLLERYVNMSLEAKHIVMHFLQQGYKHIFPTQKRQG